MRSSGYLRDQQLVYTVKGLDKVDLFFRITNTAVKDVLYRGHLKQMICALRLAQG
ncbi:hypothetical protein BTN49_1250 [Candidatus Enterovibrio escicola]|uniref:Uncharacterized protein n=1 Tax=Candidatus Enterovibrio escicola TaxID=1927127 RepID=A0A2A5T522_9GAMM|nr:hypothetical protein BTN49_1250 [Candidatus Enterovibrio escacola]